MRWGESQIVFNMLVLLQNAHYDNAILFYSLKGQTDEKLLATSLEFRNTYIIFLKKFIQFFIGLSLLNINKYPTAALGLNAIGSYIHHL